MVASCLSGTLSVLWQNLFHRGREGTHVRNAVAKMHALGRGRLMRQADPGAAGRARPDRPRLEPAATIRTDIGKHRVDTSPAKAAFIAADHRLSRLRRQIAVTAFTVRPQCQHLILLMVGALPMHSPDLVAWPASHTDSSKAFTKTKGLPAAALFQSDMRCGNQAAVSSTISSSAFCAGPESWPRASSSRSTSSITAIGAESP